MKSGITFANWRGPAEKIGNTRILETFDYRSGFHIALGGNLALSEHTGIQVELMYNQRGVKYEFNGQSYWFFSTDSGASLFSFGTKKIELVITTTYLEMPILYYIRTARVELSAGMGMGYLARAKGAGMLFYSGLTESGTAVAPFKVVLNFDYLRDPLQRQPASNGYYQVLDGQLVEIPYEIGAYYESSGVAKRSFHQLDAHLIAGISFFLSQELYVGLRMNYGITDVTNNRQDVAKTHIEPDKNIILNDDFDRQFAFQASVGLRF